MIPYLGASLTLLLAFTIFIVKDYIRDLRSENKRLQSEVDTAWRLYDNDHRELCAMKGLHVTEPYGPQQTGDKQPPFSFSGIGITQIRDRELRKQREREAETQPRFDKAALTQPSEGEIVEAARRAASNGER